MTNLIRRLAMLLLGCSLAAGAARAQTTGLTYGPFAGSEGYQEIALGARSWYVAFHGLNATQINPVYLAWHARAAQLCAGLGLPSFMELRHPTERVLVGDSISSLDERDTRTPMLRVVKPVYIPVFVPRQPLAEPLTDLPEQVTPTRTGAIRCLDAADAVRDPRRVQSVSAALAAARQAGLKVP